MMKSDLYQVITRHVFLSCLHAYECMCVDVMVYRQVDVYICMCMCMCMCVRMCI